MVGLKTNKQTKAKKLVSTKYVLVFCFVSIENFRIIQKIREFRFGKDKFYRIDFRFLSYHFMKFCIIFFVVVLCPTIRLVTVSFKVRHVLGALIMI